LFEHESACNCQFFGKITVYCFKCNGFLLLGNGTLMALIVYEWGEDVCAEVILMADIQKKKPDCIPASS